MPPREVRSRMTPDEMSQVEETAREAWSRGDMAATATLVYEEYGTEIYSFLLAQFPGQASSADDVFSQFSEDFWCGLPSFGWRCSLRAWCYKVARSAASRYRRTPDNQRGRRVPVSSAPWVDAFIQRTRTTTQPHLRTDVKDEFHRLREKLAEEDRDLLILRVDRGLAWRDIAYAMLGVDQPADNEAILRKEAALRQRYSEVKKRLKALAIDSGLLKK